MRSYPNLLFVLVSLLGLTAHAQNKVGNGGNAVVCEHGGLKTAELLDFYEAGLKPTAEAKDFKAIATEKFEALSKVAPKLAKQYLARLPDMIGETDFTADTKLVAIPDSLHIFEPRSKDCKVLQAAVRRARVTTGEKRFLFEDDVWKVLPEVQKAGLVAHEIVYEHLSKLGEKDSTKVRKIVAVIFAKKAASADEFWELVKELALPIYP